MLTFYTFYWLDSLSQLPEEGIQYRIRQQCLPSQKLKEEPSNITVAIQTVAPILVVLAAGYLIAILIVMSSDLPMERYSITGYVKLFQIGQNKMHIKGWCKINSNTKISFMLQAFTYCLTILLKINPICVSVYHIVCLLKLFVHKERRVSPSFS